MEFSLENFLKQQPSNTLPGLADMVTAGIQILDLKISADMNRALMAAAALGEVENNLPYHNNTHIRKMMLQLLRLITAHREINNKTQLIDDVRIVAMMITACIHDLGHPGAGGPELGQGAIEQKSFDMARPHLIGLGEDVLNDINVMILCTDVTAAEGKDSLTNQMKSAYAAHFTPGKSNDFYLDERLSRLRGDKILSLMCLLLHEADIATSAGISYEITKSETILYATEIGHTPAKPSHIIGFFDAICGGGMMSDAGRELYAAPMREIYAAAQADLAAGDLPFERG